MKISLKLFAVSVIVLLAACASTPQNPFVGAWAVSMESPIGTIPGTISFADDGTGSMAFEVPGQESPPAAFQGAAFDGNAVKFSAAIDAQGQQFNMEFSGNVEGDNISGEFATDFGAFAVTGTRK